MHRDEGICSASSCRQSPQLLEMKLHAIVGRFEVVQGTCRGAVWHNLPRDQGACCVHSYKVERLEFLF